MYHCTTYLLKTIKCVEDFMIHITKKTDVLQNEKTQWIKLLGYLAFFLKNKFLGNLLLRTKL